MFDTDLFFAPLERYPWAVTVLQLLALIVVVFLASVLTHLVLVRSVGRMVRARPGAWGEALLARGVLSRFAHIVPALFV